MDVQSSIREGKVDLPALVASKNPRLARLLPRFVYSYLERILHLKQINEFIAIHGHESGVEFAHSTLDYLGVKYQVEGEHRLDPDRRYIIVSNHPLGGLDGVVLIDHFGRLFEKIYFPVNDILLNLSSFEDLFIPINKHGAQRVSLARELDRVYGSTAQVLYFPAGLCSRKRRGKVRDLLWQGNFVGKAVRYARDVVPVYFEGRNSNFFYNLSIIRRALGIKANIEMLYLVDEMFSQRGASLRLHVGEPVSYTRLEANREGYTRQQWAAWFKERVYQMAP